MGEFVLKLAEEICKRRPDATLPVVIELTNVSKKNVELLSSRGFHVRDVIESLNIVTGELPVEPRIANAIGKLKIVRSMTTSSEITPL
jgi:hypothetical protein